MAECLALEGAICLHAEGKRHTIAAVRSPDHLVAWYDFDGAAPVDVSGSGHHLSDVVAGPALFGAASAYLDGSGFAEAPGSMETEFTVALWVFLLEDSTGVWRTVLGQASSLTALTPTVVLEPHQRRLTATVETEGGDASVATHGAIPLRRWMHVALTSGGGLLRLYLNGLLEEERILDSAVVPSDGTLRVGKDPWRAGTRMYVDDLRVYDRPLEPADVHALAPTSVTGVAPEPVSLGCMSCTREAAEKTCDRLCSLSELYAIGYHVARVQGWAKPSDEIWYHNQVDVSGAPERLALCC